MSLFPAYSAGTSTEEVNPTTKTDNGNFFIC